MDLKKKLKLEKGISLLEVVIGIGLVSTLMVILMDTFILHGQIFNIGMGRSDMQYSSNRLEESLGSSIRSAKEVISSRTIDSDPYTTSTNTLILSLPSIDQNKGIIADTYDYIVFYLDGTNLNYYLEPDNLSSRIIQDKIAAEYVESLSFLYDHSDFGSVNNIYVDVNFYKKSTVASGKYEYSSSFKLGNK